MADLLGLMAAAFCVYAALIVCIALSTNDRELGRN